jgi:hypothetical protein
MVANDNDEDEDSARRIDVELFIVHPTMAPAEITAALGLEPKFIHGVGEPRKTPRGMALPGRYPDTRWRYSMRYVVRDQHFASKITLLVDRLLPHKSFFTDLRNSGGDAQIIVQLLGDGYLGDSVPASTLAKMSDLQLAFGIECYIVPQNS